MPLRSCKRAAPLQLLKSLPRDTASGLPLHLEPLWLAVLQPSSYAVTGNSKETTVAYLPYICALAQRPTNTLWVCQ